MKPITVDQLVAGVGSEITSPWRTVTQQMIDLFADATDDHQFIHCDPERAAAAAYEWQGTRGGALGIVRTAWLFGPPGNDFPAKILTAASRAAASGEPLKLVADEIGSPTYTHDLAEGIVELIGESAVAGVHHVVNAGAASRAGWAREVLRQVTALRGGEGWDVATQDVPASTWPRASTPPAWAVLAPTPLPTGEPLRPWQAAVADYLPALLRQHVTAVSAGAAS